MDLDPNDPKALNKVREEIQRLIISARVPEELEEAILSAYDDMVDTIREKGGEPKSLTASRPPQHAIGEDSELSHAGQYVSIFNVPARPHHSNLQTHTWPACTPLEPFPTG